MREAEATEARVFSGLLRPLQKEQRIIAASSNPRPSSIVKGTGIDRAKEVSSG